jgi:hypothetical protein
LLMIAVATIPRSELAWALSGAWTTKTPMPTARYGLGVGVLSGGVYAVGGLQRHHVPQHGRGI